MGQMGWGWGGQAGDAVRGSLQHEKAAVGARTNGNLNNSDLLSMYSTGLLAKRCTAKLQTQPNRRPHQLHT